jgi:hypothetical protein
MLDNMTDGLFDIIEAKLFRLHDDFDPELKAKYIERINKSSVKPTQIWQLIYDQRQLYRNVKDLYNT